MDTVSVRKHESERSPASYNLVISSGGSRAILAGGGAIAAFHMAGITQWQTIGGISGGSIPALMLAGGATPSTLIRRAMDCDFRSLVERKAGLFGTIKAFLLKDYYENRNPRPIEGILGTEKMAEFVDSFHPTWPKGFWTVAAAGTSQILFTEDGVREYRADGTVTQISDKPAPVGLAIRATCTIPGIISAVSYGDHYLYDGAHTKDGMCPVGIPIRYFGAEAKKTIACCLGEEFNSGAIGILRRFWRWIWAVPPEPQWGPETVGVISIRPKISHIHALNFTLSPDQKWLAVLLGFRATVYRLHREGLLKGERLERVNALLREIGKFDSIQPARASQPQRLAPRAEAAFAKYVA